MSDEGYNEYGEDQYDWEGGRNWAEACSICFHANCEIALPRCMDQFCGACLTKVFHLQIEASWGLRAEPLKCPVCFMGVDEETYANYVDEEHMEMMDRFAEARNRGVVRFCPESGCGGEMVLSRPTGPASGAGAPDGPEQTGALEGIRERMVEAGLDASGLSDLVDSFSIPEEDRENLPKVDSVASAFFQTFEALVRTGRALDPVTEAELSSSLIGLAPPGPLLRALELCHLARFPRALCAICAAPSCLHCCQPWHDGVSCEDAAVASGSESLVAIMKDSKRCPHCKVWTSRDDGCNKMSCAVCAGPEWCWVCGGSGAECTFYICALAGPNESKSTQDLETAPPELGVPDIHASTFGTFSPERSQPDASIDASAGPLEPDAPAPALDPEPAPSPSTATS